MTERRQPVHVVYGGAHLFSETLPQKLGELARRAFDEYAPDAATLAEAFALEGALAEGVHARVAHKLKTEAVEDVRVDFEDGYGVRPDEEEDEAATRAGHALALLATSSARPPFLGVRIKSLAEETRARALRTLERVLSAMGSVPRDFVVTLPKVTRAEEVSMLADALEAHESHAAGERIGIELMVEHVSAIFDAQGTLHLPKLVAAARGRCVAAHLGTYDFTASCGVTAAHQTPSHPMADFARQMMIASLVGSGVQLSDGATTTLPIPRHRAQKGETLSDAQRADNRAAVHRAWRVHYDDVRRALAFGLPQGWDLHPAQIVSRHVAVAAFFLEALPASTERLRAFLDRAAQATRVGQVFDDAATGQGLLNFFLRGLACGALNEDDVTRAGLSREELETRSFAAIVRSRSAHA